MSDNRLKVVAICGSVQRPSRTLVLLHQVLGRLEQRLPVQVRVLELTEIGPQFAGVLRREALPDSVEQALKEIEEADLLIAASPVYRASYTGLFKHLFDFVHHLALRNTPVLLAATGGSERHALVIDHQLRPLFGFFQAHSLPIGLYASEADFNDYQITDADLLGRIERAIEPIVQHFSTPGLATA
ncbi:FMN reductase [Pseudomonas sp. CCM 7891]|uniref:FMN reductase n=1 Tax=Pseudomonas karstica TaxID=1055468 RepID=A0A7X2UWG3_9PSED|nr:FMN reductase [Pseudomonas karstica]MTD17969.1 FMN reductase [Pseudomonas karstica]